ncbi:LacI family DNA-binding transcriptional regulator [Antribacter gilvus]|uniref:LacI family DNA-binding transcriptional regulator n=1 Tax=Antribacter gilvus TaxID=2304675 RepID=UPI000F7BAA87|nr:LacI family DNA-binding transcriptional regulator [Antribacter gilvus]
MSRERGSRPTLAKVAELAGVSVSTASLAFSGAGPITAETRERVLQAARDLEYSGPNPLGRQLRSGRSGIVGVLIGDQLGRSFRDPVSIQVLHGLVSTIGEQGLGVLLVPGTPQGSLQLAGLETVGLPPAVDPLVEAAAMDVAVLVWGALTDDPNVAALQRRGVPVVIGEGRAVPGAPLVTIDDRRGTAEAVRHLVELGHTRIAEIALPFGRDERSGPVSPERLEQADRTPTRNRLGGVRDVIQPVLSWETPASLVEHGRDAAMEILGAWVPTSERPTAIFAHSDLLAAGAVIAARELGLRIPEDVSIAGFDGLDLPWLSPDVLTSVHQPLAEKGKALGRAVIALLAGDDPETITLEVGLVQGTTTGPVPEL